MRIQQRVAAVTMLGLAAGVALLLQAREPEMKQMETTAVATASAQARLPVALAEPASIGGPRRVYPYSIVPGGVLSRAELAQAILADKVVAAHYAGIRVDKVERITVAKARAVHVSYRKGDKIFWTAKRVMLAPGEVLLSDGDHLIRGRCGNRISDVAMLPVEAAAPSEEELDSSVEVAQQGEGEEGALNVAAALEDGGAHQSYALLSYANGPGVSGGPWHAPSSPSGSVPGITRPITGYATPAKATGGGIAADTVADTSGRTVDTAPDSAPAATATGGRSTIETKAPAATTPADTVALLADTVLPAPDGEVKAPAIPDTLPWPGGPVLPIQPLPAPAVAEAPEPATLWLAGAGIAALLLGRGRRRRRSA